MGFKERLLSNLPIKIISLLLALFLWFFVIGQRNIEIGVEIPVRFENLPNSLVVVNNPDSQVDIRVKGPRTLLSSLDPTRIDLSLDLSSAVAGRSAYQVFPEQIVLPRGLQVSRVNPAEIIFEFAPVLTEVFPVKIETDGKPGPGYKVSQVIAVPPRVRLSGAAEELKKLKVVKTEPVVFKERTKPFRAFVSLELEGLHLTEVDPRKVEVEVDIVKHMVERPYEVPIRVVGREAFKYQVQPDRIKLLVFGHELDLENLKPEDIKVYLEAKELKPGKYRRRVIIDLPEEISLLDAQPPWFSVEIRPE